MSFIQKITTRAKKIRKGTGMKWHTALKKAGIELRGSKVTAKKKTVSKKLSQAKKTVSPSPVASGLGVMKSAYRRALEDRLGTLLLRRELAKKKADRKKLAREINIARADLRHVKN